MKIVVIGTRGIPNIMGGIETHCQELYPRLVKLGADVTILGRKSYTPQETPYVYEGVKIVPIAAPRSAGFEALIHSFRCIFTAIKLKPDIIHLHAIGPAFIAPFFRLFGIKVVYTHHGQDYNRAKWGGVAKNILRLGERTGTLFSHKVIVISKYLETWIQTRYKTTKTELIHNGVNIRPKVSKEQTEYWLKKHNLLNEKYIFALGRFVEEKGFHDLINAFKKANVPNVKLVIAGTADHQSEYSRKLCEFARENGVILPGFIHGEELQAIFENAAMFVIPSYHEGLPIVLLEALSYNLKVIASDIPANTEVPIPRECFYHLGDVDALAKMLQEAMESTKEQNYVSIIQEHYNWEKIAEDTLDLYKSIL